MTRCGRRDDIRMEHHGRYAYVGPAVLIGDEELQAVIRSTTVTLQWDQLGKAGLIVYPVS